MLKKYLKYIIAFAVVVAILVAAGICSAVFGVSDEKVTCSDCDGMGYTMCTSCHLGLVDCEDHKGDACTACGGDKKIECSDCKFNIFVGCGTCDGSGEVTADSNLYSTFWALIPPVIAIFLALITKDAISSLFIGVLAGGLLYANFNPVSAWDAVVNDGFIAAVSGTAGIFIFLVLLGVMVALVNSSGGAAAFGRWATKNIKSRVGAVFATFILGVMIFIDDYFNCLTVGSVMKPITDRHKISRAKLSYLIDATAAPVCMIAPISSWAAAVSGVVKGDDGIELFVRAIPYNFYSLLTFVFVIAITILGLDYGPMKLREMNAMLNGDLGPMETPETDEEKVVETKGRVLDLILPIIVLIVTCVLAMLYVGGLFDGEGFIAAFGNTDATVALPFGALLALIFTMIYLIARKTISFKQAMEAVPKGFIAMVPAILILTFAIALKNTTGLLGADVFVADVVNSSAEALKNFLPAIIFVVACFLAFSTGTSWGTFGILIPIVTSVFAENDPLFVIGVSACLAGAVCGDHCSPISDTTIMASAGANSDHLVHVSTQLPYAITVAGVSFVSYIIAGFVQKIYLALPIAIAIMLVTVIAINEITKRKESKAQ